MAMRAIKNAVVTTGKYTDSQSGQEKNRYQRIGVLFKDDETNDVSLKLEALPISQDWTGWINFYDRDSAKDGMNQPARQASQPAPPAVEQKVQDFDDDIPF